ncbi:Uncharacterised protein [Amycolatopsis camponoti]|uniref:Uncharacterized protein n=1 Tax=Amycolatopsis camponoti TaxID=2606593 RepID=A0A6I8LWM6_9PSEU|nr:Uncharacterised protein [Amycolatopsis camponoti]
MLGQGKVRFTGAVRHAGSGCSGAGGVPKEDSVHHAVSDICSAGLLTVDSFVTPMSVSDGKGLR